MATEPLPRIPKLAVRNRLPEDELGTDSWIETMHPALRSADNSHDEEETGRSSPQPRPSSATVDEPGLRELLASQRQSTGHISVRPTLDARAKESPKKKKKRGVKAFLTLKEPSTKAWEEFAAVEREKQKSKGLHMAAFGSSQQMPDYVPKVNSKWDGMPERTASDKVKKSTSKSRPKLSTSTSNAQPRVDSANSASNDKPSFESSTLAPDTPSLENSTQAAKKPSFETSTQAPTNGRGTPEIPVRSPARMNSNNQVVTLSAFAAPEEPIDPRQAPVSVAPQTSSTPREPPNVNEAVDLYYTMASNETHANGKQSEEDSATSPNVEHSATSWFKVATKEEDSAVSPVSPDVEHSATSWFTVATNIASHSEEATPLEPPQSPRAKNFSRPFSPTSFDSG